MQGVRKRAIKSLHKTLDLRNWGGGAFSYGVGAVFAHVKFNKFIEFPSVDIVEETRHSGEKSGLEVEYWESLTSGWHLNSKHLWKYTNNEPPNESKEILVIQN